MNVKSYNILLNDMMNYMKANQNKITDFNEGSLIRTMFESISRVMESAYIDTRNGYSNELKEIAYSIFNFQRKAGVKATSVVKFSRAKAINTRSTIPIGTQVSCGNLIYYTTTLGVIESNQVTSNEVTVVAEKIGLEYNVNIGDINTFDNALSMDIISVTNITRADGGTNEETETEMLARFKKYINGLQGTNKYGFISTILADDVRSVSVEEKFPPYLNIYNAIVYVDDGTGGLSDELKQRIEDKINGLDNAINPGCRATGIQVLVSSAAPVYVHIKVVVKIYRTEQNKAIFDVKEAIQKEINSLKIGESLYISSIVLRLRRYSYIKDVTTVLIDNVADNLNVKSNQIIRVTSSDIEVTPVSI